MLVLSIFGGLETFTSECLYPYRYVISPLAIIAGLAFVALALRQGAHLYLWRHRVASAVIGTPLLVMALLAGDYLVSPLWERSYLNEADPAATANVSRETSMASGMAGASAAATGTTHRGEFKGADDFHFGRGDALLIRGEGDKAVLRFESFSVRNGPDLYVYLSRDELGTRVDEALNLGRLKATDGAFNYEVPASIDLRDVRSVVVWCKQFAVQFAVAVLTR